MDRLPSGSGESIEQAVKAKGEGKIRATALASIAEARAKVDARLLQRSALLLRALLRVLHTAVPGASPELIGAVVADLDSLWEYGQKLDRKLQALSRMNGLRDARQIQAVLVDIEVDQVDYAHLCIGRLRKALPRIEDLLDRRINQSVKTHKKTRRTKRGRTSTK